MVSFIPISYEYHVELSEPRQKDFLIHAKVISNHKARDQLTTPGAPHSWPRHTSPPLHGSERHPWKDTT